MSTDQPPITEPPNQPPKEENNEQPNEEPPKEPVKESPKESQNNIPKKEYILLRISKKIYCLDKQDIPESGMLRTIYEMPGETIVDVDQNFKTILLNFFFNAIKKENYRGISKILVDPQNYVELIKISRYFQIDEKIMTNKIKLHWVYENIFFTDDKKFHMFIGEYKNEEVLSITYNDKTSILPYEAYNIVTEALVIDLNLLYYGFSIMKEYISDTVLILYVDNQYKIYVNNHFHSNLQLKPRSITYDSVKNQYTF